eukprot:COSAG01_NODE_8767_length_2666_cov_1.573822_3_plen_107_part_00
MQGSCTASLSSCIHYDTLRSDPNNGRTVADGGIVGCLSSPCGKPNLPRAYHEYPAFSHLRYCLRCFSSSLSCLVAPRSILIGSPVMTEIRSSCDDDEDDSPLRRKN